MKPWRRRMWCIPPRTDAAFVASMERVPRVYARPYDPRRPVVCMDEQPKQLIRESRQPITTARGEQRIDLIHTPRHGSWLNVAECELSVLGRQCLDRRIAGIATIDREARAWSDARNAAQTGVDWHFTTDNARTKLKRLYPKIVE